MSYESDGGYKLIPDHLVRAMLGVLAEVDPDIMDDIANEMIDKLAHHIRQYRDSSIEGAAVVAETGDFYGQFQTSGDERRAREIASNIRALSQLPG